MNIIDTHNASLQPAHASEPDILQRLQYIADSPPSDYGGFHEQAIQTVKDAIEYINSHASNEKK